MHHDDIWESQGKIKREGREETWQTLTMLRHLALCMNNLLWQLPLPAAVGS